MIGRLPSPRTFVSQAKNYCILSQILWFLIFTQTQPISQDCGTPVIDLESCLKSTELVLKLHDDKMIEWSH